MKQITVLGNTLDKEQTKAATTNHKNTIIIAGAGSGKSLTMVGKIKYLTTSIHIPLSNILCITFTNAAALSLEEKIKKELNQENKVYTFHKLALEILDDHHITYQIAEADLLDYLIEEIFSSLNNSPYFKKLFLTKNYTTSPYFSTYKKTISRFIKLFIGNYYNPNYLQKIIQKARPKDRPYLKIIAQIYKMYILEKNSQGLIDFDDMIYQATSLVTKKGITKTYQYIIIDEYQDTSHVRENLVRAIIEKTNALITVVGDDFQSIYRFSGCDLNNFLGFPHNFRPVKKLYLTSTYRNSQELINVAGSFVMQNPRQITKNLKSAKKILKPIVIFFYQDIKKDFPKALNHIPSDNLLILGRNNLDIYKCVNASQINSSHINHPTKNITYLTIHKSKGLEEDNTLIINLSNDSNSLPSLIEDERIMKYVQPKKDLYPHEEERRLFYVALTRTKNYCYLYVPKKNPSIFIEELIKNYSKYLTIINL